MTNVISFQLDVHVESLVGKISDKPHKILNGFGCRLWLWPQIMYLLKDIGGLGGGGSNLHAQSRFLVSVVCFIRINWSYSSPLDYLLAPLARAKHQTPNILVDHWGMDEIVLN